LCLAQVFDQGGVWDQTVFVVHHHRIYRDGNISLPSKHLGQLEESFFFAEFDLVKIFMDEGTTVIDLRIYVMQARL
jgi:hypothetical protein